MVNNNEIAEIKEVLDVVGDKLPNIINGLMKNLYSEDAGIQMGKAVGGMYQELKAAGMEDKDIMPLIKEYLATLRMFGNSDEGKLKIKV